MGGADGRGPAERPEWPEWHGAQTAGVMTAGERPMESPKSPGPGLRGCGEDLSPAADGYEEFSHPPLLALLSRTATRPLGTALWSPTVFAPGQHLCSPLSAADDKVPAPEERATDDAVALAEGIAEEILLRSCTTLMIRNLPNKLTPAMIMDCVHELGFENQYDYLFVPIDTNAPGWANRNLGYCFLNLITPEAAQRFCRQAYGYSFRQAVSSTKTSKISIAEEQGVHANLRRIDRPGPRKEQRGHGKCNSLPFVRSFGEMQAMTPGSALALLEAPGPNGFMPSP
jgi:hypothetical protein